ncbi:MAG: hypothetical protein H7A44_08500 [Opitutaceae bacterium]|nr:hypothetical protein [Cephaloticoccus sp.]MCP5530470.1 hypothetical protein [Opitutaceae bacterium]
MQIPAVIRRYTLGAYVDPHDPDIRHAAHVIHRLESPAPWNLDDTAAETTETLITRTATPLPVPAEVIAAPPESDPEPAPSAPIPSVLQDVVVLQPDSSGTLDLRTANPANPEINPFAVRDQPDGGRNELVVEIGGIIHGAVACALVNGRTLKPGDRLESLTLEFVESDSLVFRHADRLLRLPIGQPIRLLLPVS